MLSAVAMTASRVSRCLEWIAISAPRAFLDGNGRAKAATLLRTPLRVGQRRCETLRAPGWGSPTRSSTNERLGSRTAHGNGTAFSAVAPSERPVLPSIDPIFGSGIPQARIVIQHSGRLFGSAFCERDPHCLTLCDPFATYRQVTHSPASTICRCITGALNTEAPPAWSGVSLRRSSPSASVMAPNDAAPVRFFLTDGSAALLRASFALRSGARSARFVRSILLLAFRIPPDMERACRTAETM